MAAEAADATLVEGQPAHYRLPDEPGYFPAGSDDADAVVVRLERATLYQLRPRHGDGDAPLASGALTLRDPDAGTAGDVALVGQCGDALFYLLCDDAVTRKRDRAEFVLLLPEECLVLDLTDCAAADVLRAEGLLAARTRFHAEGAGPPADLPTDLVSRSMYGLAEGVSQLAVGAGAAGASRIERYGERKKEGVTECRDVKVGRGSLALAKGTRAASEMTLSVATTVSDKISDVLGGKVGSAVTAKEGDGAVKRLSRNLLLASALSYAEIGNGAAEGYERLVREAAAQATTYVDARYGAEAAELARHTAGATANFGRTALTARRVVNAKKLVKSAVKRRVKERVKETVRG